jgi:hypothetical protein
MFFFVDDQLIYNLPGVILTRGAIIESAVGSWVGWTVGYYRALTTPLMRASG